MRIPKVSLDWQVKAKNAWSFTLGFGRVGRTTYIDLFLVVVKFTVPEKRGTPRLS